MWPAAAFALFLILWSPLAGALRGALQSAFPAAFQPIVGGAVALVAGALLVLAVRRINAHRGRGIILVAAGLIVSVACIASFRTGNASVDAVEATHFVEYGVLTWLLYRVWRDRSDASALLLPLLVGAIVGTLDEWVQWLVPERIGEMRDVALDGVAMAAGLLVSVGADPPAIWNRALRAGSARRLAGAASVAIAAFAFFFQCVHAGYAIADPQIGRFLSCFDREGLAAAARRRAVEWAGRDPGAPARLSREDQFRAEAIWHVQRRNDDVAAGRWAAAWAENRILEIYFAPALDLHGPRTGVGYRWADAQRADMQARAGPAAGGYVSDANPYPIYTWPKPAIWCVTLAGIAGALAAGALAEQRRAAREAGPDIIRSQTR
jgi:VanZ family protein